MIGILLCVIGFVVTYAMARRSLAGGFGTLAAIGYAYGLIRARAPDGGTHFLFDAALLGLYVGHFSLPLNQDLRDRSRVVRDWTLVLVAWPLVCVAYSPIIADAQPLLVQLVGLRGIALMLPCMILGSRLTREDMDQLATLLASLNCLTLVFAILEYVYGVDVLIPRNQVTELVYLSQDVQAGGEVFYRIPSSFINAHAYGGVMLNSIPFIAHGLDNDRRSRALCWMGLGAAGIGIFLCGARTPVVVFAVSTLYVLLSLRMRGATFLAFAISAAGIYYLVTHFERLQRFETLGDTDLVRERLGQSVNSSSFLDALVNYPLGAGLASAFGTSIPFFLSDGVRPQIGIESEYGHMLIEQGIPGLLLWLGLLFQLFFRKATLSMCSPTAASYVKVLVPIAWASALLGSGILTSIPASSLLLLMMGMRLAAPAHVPAPLALRHVGTGPRRPTRTPARVRASVRTISST